MDANQVDDRRGGIEAVTRKGGLFLMDQAGLADGQSRHTEEASMPMVNS